MQDFFKSKINYLKQKISSFKEAIISDFESIFSQKKKKNFLSIDFGQAFIKIAYLQPIGKRFKVLDYSLKKISQPTEDSREEIVKFIKKFLQEKSISEKETYLSLSCQDSIVIKRLTLPVLPRQEILGAAKWQLKEEVNFDLEDALSNWQIIKEYTDKEGTKNNDIMFILAKAETIYKYLSIIFDCNLEPFGILASEFSYLSFLNNAKEELQTKAVLDIGYRRATLSIFSKGKLSFVRELSFSSHKLTHSLTGTLASDTGKVDISYEEAEKIKEEFGIVQDENSILRDNIRAIQIISLMRPALEVLIRDLRHSFDYYASNFQEGNPTVLYLTGGGANLKNLDKYLSKQLNINISKLPITDCIDAEVIDVQRLSKDYNQLSGVLGAALGNFEYSDLLPSEVKSKKVELIERISLRLIAYLIGAIFLLSLFFVKFQARDYKTRLKNAQIHLQTIGEIQILKKATDSIESLMSQVQEDKVPAESILRVISELIPANVVLKNLVLDQERDILVLKGVVSDRQKSAEFILVKFMGDMEKTSFFEEATLVSSRKVNKLQEFEIKCDLSR